MNENYRLGNDINRVCQHCIFDDYQDEVAESRATLAEAKESCVSYTHCTGITLEPRDGQYYLKTSMELVGVSSAIRKVFEIILRKPRVSKN